MPSFGYQTLRQRDRRGLAGVDNHGDSKDEIKPQVDKNTIIDDIILAEGRLVSLGCAKGHLSFVMSTTSTQALAQMELWNNNGSYENKVYMLPKHPGRKVARLHRKKLGGTGCTLQRAGRLYGCDRQKAPASRSTIVY